jgi:hypothetical protein
MGGGKGDARSPALSTVLQAAAKMLQGKPGVVDSSSSDLLQALLQAQSAAAPPSAQPSRRR